MHRTMTAPTTPRYRIAPLRSHRREHGVAACLIPSSFPRAATARRAGGSSSGRSPSAENTCALAEKEDG